MASIRKQLRNNSVALISLVIALGSLGYNTWRNETTEEQRNIRHASFRVLESLGELQEVVDYRRYYLVEAPSPEQEGASRLRGWGRVSMIRDLMNLMPQPAPQAGQDLNQLWTDQFAALNERGPGGQPTEAARLAEQQLTAAINDTRMAVVDVLKSLE